MSSPLDLHFFHLLATSHARLVGSPLAPPSLSPEAAVRWLYEEAPFAILAHNAEPDPVFIYGNLAAQRHFDYSWDELTRLHSRYSAELPNREERQQLLDRVRRDGYASDYRGVRISKSGKRFLIEDATLWQLIDDEGTIHGQAVRIMKTSPVA